MHFYSFHSNCDLLFAWSCVKKIQLITPCVVVFRISTVGKVSPVGWVCHRLRWPSSRHTCTNNIKNYVHYLVVSEWMDAWMWYYCFWVRVFDPWIGWVGVPSCVLSRVPWYGIKQWMAHKTPIGFDGRICHGKVKLVHTWDFLFQTRLSAQSSILSHHNIYIYIYN